MGFKKAKNRTLTSYDNGSNCGFDTKLNAKVSSSRRNLSGYLFELQNREFDINSHSNELEQSDAKINKLSISVSDYIEDHSDE